MDGMANKEPKRQGRKNPNRLSEERRKAAGRGLARVRAQVMTPEQRSERARKVALAVWARRREAEKAGAKKKTAAKKKAAKKK